MKPEAFIDLVRAKVQEIRPGYRVEGCVASDGYGDFWLQLWCTDETALSGAFVRPGLVESESDEFLDDFAVTRAELLISKIDRAYKEGTPPK